MTLGQDELEIIEKIKLLDEKTKLELSRRIELKRSSERQIWYCTIGRSCNGEPHEGAPHKHARGDQWPPEGVDWDVWFYMSGRGVGKTRAGGNWTRQMSRYTGRLALIGRRGTDVRATMVEGPSGIIRACELAGETYDWKPALKEFTFENGAKAFGYSAEEPESLRGPEHGGGWLDEPCHMDLIEEVWSNYNLGLRSEGVPGGAKTLLTSSPLPIAWTKERISEKGQVIKNELGEPLLDEEGNIERAPRTVLVQVPTSVNLKNLDEGYKRRVINPLRGTRKGKQELDAMLLEDVEGALWEADWLKRELIKVTDMDRIVVAIDPAGSDRKVPDMTGIVSAGRSGDDYCVFSDLSDHYSASGWARAAVAEYERLGAHAIVAERNYGGDMVENTLRSVGFKGRVIQVRASQGKKLRAEPISALYEQGHVLHLAGADLAELEDEMLTWVPEITKKSPNRVDALVWALADLSKRGGGQGKLGVPRGSIRREIPNRSPGSQYARKNWNR